MVVSDQPIDLQTERWRAALLAWRVDGKPVTDPSRPDDQQSLINLLAIPGEIGDARVPADKKRAEDCTSVLSRTAGRMLITDDNMGTEWRYPLGLEQ